MPRSAVVGGVAVMCRLATAHRPTADIDAVVRDDAVPSAAEMLVAQGATRTTTGVDLGGVRIDLLEVGDVPTPAELPDDQLDRAFVTAHAWALATAEPVNVIARSMRGGTLASAEVDLATPASLVAMKLHAIRKRREARLVKRGSDAYDIYRLLALLDADGSIGVVLRQAPAGSASGARAKSRRTSPSMRNAPCSGSETPSPQERCSSSQMTSVQWERRSSSGSATPAESEFRWCSCSLDEFLQRPGVPLLFLIRHETASPKTLVRPPTP